MGIQLLQFLLKEEVILQTQSQCCSLVDLFFKSLRGGAVINADFQTFQLITAQSAH